MNTGLTPHQVHILRLRFGFDAAAGFTLAEVAKAVRLSHEAVRQTERRALRKIQADPSVLDGTDLIDAQKAVLLTAAQPPRTKGKAWRETERRYGKPMADVLIGLIEKHQGQQQPILDELGVSAKTYYRWRRAVGIGANREVVDVVPPLTFKQQFMLNKRFGLDGERPHSVSELAGMLNVTPGAIGGFQRVAVRKVARDASLVSPQAYATIMEAKTRMPSVVLGAVA